MIFVRYESTPLNNRPPPICSHPTTRPWLSLPSLALDISRFSVLQRFCPRIHHDPPSSQSAPYFRPQPTSSRLSSKSSPFLSWPPHLSCPQALPRLIMGCSAVSGWLCQGPASPDQPIRPDVTVTNHPDFRPWTSCQVFDRAVLSLVYLPNSPCNICPTAVLPLSWSKVLARYAN